MKDDGRDQPVLDELFGIILKSAEKAVAADEKIKGETKAVEWKERDKPSPDELGRDPNATPSGAPEVEVTDASAKKIGDAVADSVQKKTAGKTENVGNGTPETSGGRDPRQRDEWGRFLPGAQKQPAQPGMGEKAGSKAGSWAGRGIGAVLGTAVGTYFGGPAGAKVGQMLGEELGGKVGDKVGGEVGAIGDKVVKSALAPDSKDTLVNVMPDAVKSIVEWYREMDKATEAMLRWNFEFSYASAEMAAVNAERQARETYRDKEKGDRLAGSAKYLADSEQDRRDKTKNLDVIPRALDNMVQAVKNQVVGALLEPLDKAVGHLGKLIGLAEEQQDKTLNPYEFMDSAGARGEAIARRGLEKQKAIAEEMDRSSRRLR